MHAVNVTFSPPTPLGVIPLVVSAKSTGSPAPIMTIDIYSFDQNPSFDLGEVNQS
jgi:hypothetical protein